MRQDVKELADAMEIGWGMCPRNTFVGTYTKSPEACCPIAHAVLGAIGQLPHRYILDRALRIFPVLGKQKVDDYDLRSSIISLADRHGWSTPQVVAWLRTKEDMT